MTSVVGCVHQLSKNVLYVTSVSCWCEQCNVWVQCVFREFQKVSSRKLERRDLSRFRELSRTQASPLATQYFSWFFLVEVWREHCCWQVFLNLSSFIFLVGKWCWQTVTLSSYWIEPVFRSFMLRFKFVLKVYTNYIFSLKLPQSCFHCNPSTLVHSNQQHDSYPTCDYKVFNETFVAILFMWNRNKPK